MSTIISKLNKNYNKLINIKKAKWLKIQTCTVKIKVI